MELSRTRSAHIIMFMCNCSINLYTSQSCASRFKVKIKTMFEIVSCNSGAALTLCYARLSRLKSYPVLRYVTHFSYCRLHCWLFFLESNSFSLIDDVDVAGVMECKLIHMNQERWKLVLLMVVNFPQSVLLNIWSLWPRGGSSGMFPLQEQNVSVCIVDFHMS